MKLLHISDLHIGKRVNEFSMLEDQKHVLAQILSLADTELPAAVLIAGDVYDKSVPSAEAVQLFDEFLCALAKRRLRVFIISGNHDSPERLAFGGRLMDGSGVYISPVYSGIVDPILLEDDFGEVAFYLLPFIKPSNVRRYYEEENIESYTDAVACAIRHMEIDPARRNVIITHQFVTGATRSESETISVGGTDNVDAEVFDAFEYVALGHIHGPQPVGRPEVRYCGTPLKYSFSEADHSKSATVVELGAKGEIAISTRPLTPLRDMRKLRGSYSELVKRENYIGTNTDDYLHITLTDEQDIPDVMAKLRTVYPNVMRLDYDNRRTRSDAVLTAGEQTLQQTPQELFAAFYETQNGQPMTEEQQLFCSRIIERIWEENE